MDAMSSCDEPDAEPMSIDMLEYIRGGSQSYSRIKRREARYKVRDCINQGQVEWK